ncbi:unnamed protein product [Brassica rapa]|uniref:Uncharacterized protein n=1 Tax=Brassica campestris TaxID=3711 RepID=A0A3P5YWM4_BRACM|nr:unnamed protein product [Brassica rapa]VDC68054.1 unnamed protein product [Brassica rapa]
METERVKRKLGGGGVAETTTSTGTERVALWWWCLRICSPESEDKA